MPVQLNHLIVQARDSQASARFLAGLCGLPEPDRFGPFFVVKTANGVSLDFIDTVGKVSVQHYAFLISEAEFDEIFGRLRELDLPFWADPARRRPGEINHGDGGRGVYFEDPDGHFLEILTRPYGSSVDSSVGSSVGSGAGSSEGGGDLGGGGGGSGDGDSSDER